MFLIHCTIKNIFIELLISLNFVIQLGRNFKFREDFLTPPEKAIVKPDVLTVKDALEKMQGFAELVVRFQ